MHRFALSGLGIGSSLLALAAAAPAYAQAAPGATAAVGDSVGIGEIVVTARKREESLMNVPSSVLAFSERQLESLNAKSISDLNGVAPNVRLNVEGGLSIRGITSTARNAGFEAGAAVYIDGVYQGRPRGNDQDLNDIARMEVLRGPQGTLYGKNTTAGAVSLVTIRPGDTWTGRSEVQYGRFDDLRVAGYVAGPLVQGLAGIKLAASRRKADGYQINLGTGDKLGNKDSWTGRGELRLTPGIFDIALRGDYSNDKGVNPAYKPVSGFAAPLAPGLDTINTNTSYLQHLRGGGASLSIDADVGNGYTVTSISAWRKQRFTLQWDDDWSPLNAVYHLFQDKAEQTTQELRITSPDNGIFSWIVGGFYFHQKLFSDHPVTLTTAFPIQGVLDDNVTTKTDALAGFANADIHFNSALTLNLGLRYTHERKKLDFLQRGIALLGYPDLAIKDRFTNNDLSPTVSLSYKFSPDVTAYLRFSRGFKSGGWNPDITSTARIGFGPEKVTNYEAGVRTRLANGRLTVNLTGYYMNYDNLQVSQYLGLFVGYVITNAGKARVKGLELEVSARPVNWLNLSVGSAYNLAKYVDFASGTGTNYAGQQFTNAPKFSGYASFDADIPLNASMHIKGHGDVRYQSKIYFDDPRTVVAGVGEFSQGRYAVANARVGLAFANGIELSGYIDNITDNRAKNARIRDTVGLGLVLDTFMPPRRYGIRASYQF